MVVFGGIIMTENVLREKMNQTLKNELRSMMLQTRAGLDLTQNKMSERYVMSENSYSSLEKGEYMCGTLTTILLLCDQNDSAHVLEEIATKLKKLREGE